MYRMLVHLFKNRLKILRIKKTIGGGSAWSGDGGGGGHKSQISLPSRPKYTKTEKNGQFHARFGL
jgi:hypothetical protein